MTGNNYPDSFYLFHISSSLRQGDIHAWFAVAGISLILVSLLRFIPTFVEGVMNVIGSVCLIISLLIFFFRDACGHNPTAFEQTGPILTLILFGLLVTPFLIVNINMATLDLFMNINGSGRIVISDAAEVNS